MLRARRMAWLLVPLALTACGPSGNDSDNAPVEAEAAVAIPADPVKLAAMGEMVFKRCVACHTIDKGGANGIGPNLHGITGRAVAAGPTAYPYSAALKAKGGVWDDAALDAFLTQPMMWAPGTKMAFAGMPDAADRAAVIAYLKTQAD